MVRFFAGFTLTQFRHSYIPIDHTAAVVGWNLCLIGGQIKSVLSFDAWFFIRPAGIVVL
jgi:hypothetical protein